jgi:hypothetical protein
MDEYQPSHDYSLSADRYGCDIPWSKSIGDMTGRHAQSHRQSPSDRDSQRHLVRREPHYCGEVDDINSHKEPITKGIYQGGTSENSQ